MKNCVVCGAEMRTELEEFGDPREPVCASCWLSGNLPEQISEEEDRDEERIKELRAMIQDCEEEIWDLERLISGHTKEILDIEKKKKKMISKQNEV